MFQDIYRFDKQDELETPVLLFYKEQIIKNIEKMIEMVGDPDRLWTHVKTHKTRELVYLQIERGIKKFKASTIAEAEMLASCYATDVLLAYPLIGPNLDRFLKLAKAYPQVNFWATGDDMDAIQRLADESDAAGVAVQFVVDFNVGMDRTGTETEDLLEIARFAESRRNLEFRGFHAYDGHIRDIDPEARCARTDNIMKDLREIRDTLLEEGIDADTLIMGGSPTFPCYAKYEDCECSPGTLVLNDAGYGLRYEDLDFTPAAAIMTRVISHPQENLFTLDLGSKAIAADPEGQRGYIVGYEETAKPLFQSEEHWVFEIADGVDKPAIGQTLFVIPTHICPCCALYPEIPVVVDGEIQETWTVQARDRRLNF